MNSAKRNVQLTNHYNVLNMILFTAEAVNIILHSKVYFKIIISSIYNLVIDLSSLYIKIQEYTSCVTTKRCSGIMCKCCEEIRCYNKVASRIPNRNIHRKNLSIISVMIKEFGGWSILSGIVEDVMGFSNSHWYH